MVWNSISRVHAKIQKNSLAVQSAAKELYVMVAPSVMALVWLCYVRVDYKKSI